MIVVFVIDTSPSMRLPLSVGNDRSGGGVSRLDLGKMAVEDIVRGLNKRVTEHNIYLQQHPAKHQSLRNMGLGFSPNDEFLLLSTGRQHTQQPATAACGAGGRLLVGFGDHKHEQATDNPNEQPVQHPSKVDSFQKELKTLQATEWEPGKVGSNNKNIVFPEDGGGSVGLNTALSVGLQMLSRYRLTFRATENFGMGRLPSPAVLNPSGGPAINALQPACLILITDGVCLRSPPSEGGGSLQLQYGNMPLREFYQEPFRWDQRIFCLGVGGKETETSTQFLHPHLRALCEVTGGSHMMLRSSGMLAQSTDLLLKQIAPPRPRDLPVPDPVKVQADHAPLVGALGTFVSGGPVCSFQALEGDLDTAQAPPKHRALLLYVPHESAAANGDAAQDISQPPTWCIPESFFPSKILDTLPPRSAQPNLLFSRFPGRLGSKSFEPSLMIKTLNRLDQLVLSNRKHACQASGQANSSIKLLSRDVYVCEWISTDGKSARGPTSPMSMDYFPVVVPGAARQSLGEGELSYLNIGVLHVPSGTSTLGYALNSGARVSTLTLLPPEPHVLLPLLVRAAEAEHRALKKVIAADAKETGGASGPSATLLKKQTMVSRNVHLDEHWRNEFRAYLFRIPPYYQNALRRSLRNVLPMSTHSLLNADGTEGALASQCFSKICFQKIRSAEQSAREKNEHIERQELELRRRGSQTFEFQVRTEQQQQPQKRLPNDQLADNAKTLLIRYGQYDPRSSTDSFLAALRGMPAPWRVGIGGSKSSESEARDVSPVKSADGPAPHKTVDTLGDLPADCLMAYYESRRRWIFGGSGLTTRGLFVEGVPNDGSNMQQCGATRNVMDESLLSIAGVGVSQMNATTTAKMGEYRERLLWSRAPVVGYGANDATGVSATTAADGGPRWSVDDDAMPMTFFNPRTGEFADSVQARVRSRLMVNFGNPYKDKRADSLIPEDYLSQSPSSKKGLANDDDVNPLTPPGSPPHDSYSASEGEGEAVFANPISRVRRSPSRSDSSEEKLVIPPAKKQKTGDSDSQGTSEPSKPPPPPKASPPGQASVAPPPRPPPKAAPPSKTPMPPSSVNKARPPGPPGPKGPPPAKPPPASVRPPPRKGSIGERPPAPPPSRPNLPPPKPPQLERATSEESSAQPAKPVVTQAQKPPPPPSAEGPDMESPNKKPNVDLPPGWMTVWSKSQKRWYFFCTKTNKSVWQWPPP
jgi:hypothetical protein